MSFSRTVGYESGSNGDAATLTNTSSDTLRFSTSAGTATISTAEHHSGTRSMHWTGTATSGLYCVEDTLTASTITGWTFDTYMKLAVAFSAEATIARLLDASLVTQATLGVNGVGALVIRNAAGTSVYASPTGQRLTVSGLWVRLLWEVTSGVSGTQRIRWYPDGSGTATDDSTVLTSNNGSSAFGFFRRGAKASTTAATSNFYFDDMVLTGTSPTAGTAVTGADQSVEPGATVTLDATASTGAGTWSLVSNTSATTPTLSSTSSTAPTYRAPADWFTGSTQTWRYTVGSSTDDTVVTVRPVTAGRIGTPVIPLRIYNPF